jgi:hypothetical protein
MNESSTITFYPNLSNVFWKPAKFNFIGNKVKTKDLTVTINNGMSFNLIECLKDSVDYSSNHNTSLFLTDLKNNDMFLEDKNSQEQKTILSKINTPIGFLSNGLSATVIKQEYDFSSNSYYLLTSDSFQFNDQDVLTFYFYNDYVMVKNYYDYYLTVLSEGQIKGVFFSPRIFPDNQSQQFNYFLGENTISLFEIDDFNNIEKFQNVITTSLSSAGRYILQSLNNLTSSSPFPKEAVLELMCFKENENITKNNIKDSFLAKYKIKPNEVQNELLLDEEIYNQNYIQNYLGMFPNEYFVESDTYCEYPLALHGLKNYQTPEYNYSFGQGFINENFGVRRVYDQIFSGTNQKNGTPNLYLGFSSNTLEFKFNYDNITEFYFPPTTDRTHISKSGLIEDGAVAGEIPYLSDRIFIKNKNYKELIPDSPQPESIKIESNTWLCSWLSGTLDGDKIWMDRYYNAAYYTMDQALSTQALVYNDRLDNTLNYTYDKPSEMILEPSVLYSYFHVGQQNRINFLNYLSSISILQITKWDSDKLNSDYNDYYGIVYYSDIDNYKLDYFKLDGTNHIIFPATTEMLEQYNLTISIWVNVNDWNFIEGSQIIGNYYESGYGLINESSITTPVITIIDNLNNKLYNLNYRFAKLNEIDLNNYKPTSDINIFQTSLIGGNPLSQIPSDNRIIQRLGDFNYWVFDKKNKIGIKFDIDDKILEKVNYDINDVLSENLNSLYEITQLEIDSKENLYLYDNISKKCIKINTFGQYIQTYNFDDNTNRIEVDSNDEIIALYGIHSVIDNNGAIWEVVGGNLYKNKKIFGNIGQVEYLTCDAKDYLWILHGQDSVSKINTNTNSISEGFPKRIGKTSGISEDPCFDYTKRRRYLNFVRVPKDKDSNTCEKTNLGTEDRAILIDSKDKEIYVLNEYGELIIKLNFVGISDFDEFNFVAEGDFTGYNFLRKYSSINKKFSWKLKIATPNGKDEKLLVLPINVNNLAPGWHNFMLTFDSINGIAKSYVDMIEESKEIFTPKKYQIYYNYRTSILVGAETVKNTTLNDLIGIDDGYKFIGDIAELRIYRKTLTRGELEQIYYSSNLAARNKDMIWNMLVGDRSYIEEIQHWFKFQLPGSKSKYFNINIYNLKIKDEIKILIEDAIKENIKKISPINTELYKINWID